MKDHESLVNLHFLQANVFVHFQPVDHEEMNEIDRQGRQLQPNQEPLAVRRRHGSSLRSQTAESENDDNRRFMIAAAHGDIDTLRRLLARNHGFIEYSDSNDWQALHEAVRGGDLETVKYLVDNGADIGWEVKGGGNPLWVAKKSLPAGHEVIKYLREIGVPEEEDE